MIFLSGRKETRTKPDENGLYEGPFTRWFCHEEMATARAAGVHIIGVQEEDDRHCKPDRALEKSRARTGKDGGPVHAAAEANLRLLDSVCFVPLRRQQHEVPAMLDEILRQANPEPEPEGFESEAEPDFELEPEPEPEPDPASEEGVPKAGGSGGRG